MPLGLPWPVPARFKIIITILWIWFKINYARICGGAACGSIVQIAGRKHRVHAPRPTSSWTFFELTGSGSHSVGLGDLPAGEALFECDYGNA